METLKLFPDNIEECAKRAAGVLEAGGVILFPTDTLYGIGADAFSDDAVAKIYRMKGRSETKPIHALVSDLAMADKYGEISDQVRMLVGRLPKGKATFIVRKHAGQDRGIVRNMETFGFRIPDNDFCTAMLKVYGAPITATSANKAGSVPGRSVEKILAQIGEGAKGVDLVIDAGEIPDSLSSTVIDLSGEQPKILREGAIPATDIYQ